VKNTTNKKNIYTEKSFFKKQKRKRSMLIFAGLSCKSTMNLYCAKCYKCNKRIFGRRKKKREPFRFIFPLLMYCCDQPNALDTAVRLTAVLL